MMGGVPCAVSQTASLVQCFLHQVHDTLPSLSCGCQLFPHPASAYMESKYFLASKDDHSNLHLLKMHPIVASYLSKLATSNSIQTSFHPLSVKQIRGEKGGWK